MAKKQVTCSSGASKNCRGTYIIGQKAARENCKRNGTHLCLNCSRKIKFSGMGNPNAKYCYDRSLFKNVDSEELAYLLGWIASDGTLQEGDICIAIDKSDKDILEKLRDFVCTDIPIATKKELVSFSLCSKEVSEDVCSLLKSPPGKKADKVQFPELQREDLKWAFLRGYFDGDGHVSSTYSVKRSPRCSISSSSPKMLEQIKNFCGIPCSVWGNEVEWAGNNCLDFLGKLYDDASYYLKRKYNNYIDWCSYIPGLTGGIGNGHNIEPFKWCKTEKEAVPPQKSSVSDSGFDLTLLRKIKQVGPVEFYTTGIKVTPSFGWYFDMVGRSSISKSGYMLANGFGVIDRSYVGPIIVPLIKVDKDASDIETPIRMVQIIPRPIVHVDFIEVDSFEELSFTARGEGGFGSTGVK